MMKNEQTAQIRENGSKFCFQVFGTRQPNLFAAANFFSLQLAHYLHSIIQLCEFQDSNLCFIVRATSFIFLKLNIQNCLLYYKLLYMQHNQESSKIAIELEQKTQPSAAKVRNRRYKKMSQLRNQGFFSQDSIKLRHPLLYHNYLGKHSQRNVKVEQTSCTLSQFLQKNLINLEYKQRLAQELEMQMEEQQKKNHEQGEDSWQLLQECSGEITLGKQQLQEESNKMRKWEIVEEEQVELQEQNLIDHAEQLFLQGKVDKAYINYNEIDNCSDQDSIREEDRDEEERYFTAQDKQDAEEDQRINQTYFTGIQDY